MLEKIKTYIKDILIPNIFFIALSAAAFYYLYSQGHAFPAGASSPGGAGDITGSTVYSAVVDFFRQFPAGDQYKSLLIFQISLGILCAYTLAAIMRNKFECGRWGGILIYSILLLPLAVPDRMAAELSPRAITYPLTLLSTTFFIRSVFGLTYGNIVFFLITAVLVSITSPQFMFMYLPAVLFCFFAFANLKDMRKSVMLALVFVITLSGGIVFQKAYNYYRHGAFAGPPVLGRNLVVPAVFLADSNEAALSSGDEAVSDFLREAVSRAREVRPARPDGKMPEFRQLSSAYASCYSDIARISREAYAFTVLKGRSSSELSAAEWAEYDKFALGAALSVLSGRYYDYARLFASNVYNGIGGLYYLAFLVFVCGYSLLVYFRHAEPAATVMFFITAMNFANYAAVSISRPALPRYTFHTDVLELAMLMAFLMYLKNRNFSAGK